MKQASLITIGNELLSGQTVNTNAAYLGRQLLSLDIPVVRQHSVPDELDAIKQALSLASEEADIVLVTGGLGPTDDDLARQGLANFLGVDLKVCDDLLDDIKAMFAVRNKPMPGINRVQAALPEGTAAIANAYGTAPGIEARFKGTAYFCMPGVPTEMRHMFTDSVVPVLKRMTGKQAIEVRKLKCVGIGESTLAEKLGDAMQRDRNPLINCTVDCGIITLHIIGKSATRDQAAQLVADEAVRLREILGPWVFGTGDQTLVAVIGKRLCEQGKTLSLAESCTGGLIAKYITDCPGASRFFTFGWVTYSNEAKTSQLKVPKEIIEQYGAVSKQVAEAMAIGARRQSNTHYSIAVTGVAGPEGGTKDKPVGLVFIGIDSDMGCTVERFLFSHDREFVRQRTVQAALYGFHKKLCFDLPQ
jgi:nicotinamide-nucleotide amidase